MLSKLIIEIAISYIASGTHIIDNGIDTRLISDTTAFCDIGRIEFYDGLNWGSLTDCTKTVTNDIASALCQTLGFDHAKSFNYGPYPNEITNTKAKYTAYTSIYCPAMQYENEYICDNDYDDCDICIDCELNNDLNNQCSSFDNDIYIYCYNDENRPSSKLFNCTYYDSEIIDPYNNSEWHLNEFESCHDAFIDDDTSSKHSNIWKFCTLFGVLALAIICMFIYCKSTKRMKHRKFTQAYMANLQNDNDIMLESNINN